MFSRITSHVFQKLSIKPSRLLPTISLIRSPLTAIRTPNRVFHIPKRNNHTTFSAEVPNIDLNTGGWNSEVVAALVPTVRYLQDGKKFSRQSKGIILSGEPGTGKKMLIKAVAGHAGVPFFLIPASRLIGQYSDTEKLIEKLFNTAYEKVPCVVGLDGIELIGSKHFTPPRTSADHHVSAVVNQILSFLSREEMRGVVVVATTNHYDSLDPALLQSGKFDTHIVVPLPNIFDRGRILEFHLRDKKLKSNLFFSDLAKMSPGFSGAQLEAWVRQANVLADGGRVPISINDLDEARSISRYGVCRKDDRSDEEKMHTAFHEAGHAVVGHLLGDKIYKVTINQYGDTNSHTEFLRENGQISKREVLKRICVALAGRAAEQLHDFEFFGARNDMLEAENYARTIIAEGLWCGSFASKIKNTSEMEDILKTQSVCAHKLLAENNKMLDNLARSLLVHSTLYKEQIIEAMAGKTIAVTNRKFSMFHHLPPSKKDLYISSCKIKY